MSRGRLATQTRGSETNACRYHSPYSSSTIAERGERIYATAIRPLVESEHFGERLVIDIETGDYAFDQKDAPLAASYSLLEKNPSAVLYAVRAGFTAATKMGGGWRVAPR